MKIDRLIGILTIYEKKVDRYWKQQTLFYLNCYDKGEMTFADCVKMIKSLSRNGEEKYEEHMQDLGEVLPHITQAMKLAILCMNSY